MSARIIALDAWRVVLRTAACVLVAGLPTQIMLAQQPEAANTVAAAHVPASSDNKSGERDVIISLPSIRSSKLGNAGQAPQLKIAPAQERSIVHGGSNVIDRNAIGSPIPRPDAGQRPAGPALGHAAAVVPPAPPGGAAVLGIREFQVPRLPAPAPRPLVLSHGTIDGAAFTRPGTALKPLGGPAKPAATGINGTTFRPKH